MKKILVADDETSLRFLIVETLEIEDYEVYEAEDGEQALYMCKQVKPDLLILDVMMPKLTGYEVAERLKSEDYKPIIIMLTAKSQKMDKEKGIESGADYYLKKPFSPMELLERVSEILED